ncbi:carboxypeptidase regulatory-like domain-containing protein [bacterium]|nr:carboxypeptidase regulatory-like domain-containing protein [candidate division CSSED10-310 bacterium]
MNRYRLVWTVVCVCLTTLAGCDRTWTGDIRGIVTDEETELPIEGAIVSARSMKNSYSISTMTDSGGEYRIDDARWGPNEVRSYHPGYEQQTRYADVIRDKSVELDFELDRIPDSEEPIITVVVTNVHGSVIPGVRADLYEKEDRYFEWYSLVDTELTDDDGIARFQVSTIYEDQIRFFRLKLSVLGYQNAQVDLTLAWFNPFPELHIIMEFPS